MYQDPFASLVLCEAVERKHSLVVGAGGELMAWRRRRRPGYLTIRFLEYIPVLVDAAKPHLMYS